MCYSSIASYWYSYCIKLNNLMGTFIYQRKKFNKQTQCYAFICARNTNRSIYEMCGWWFVSRQACGCYIFLLTTWWRCFQHTRSFESFPETVRGKPQCFTSRAAAGQIGALSRIVLLCPLCQILCKYKKHDCFPLIKAYSFICGHIRVRNYSKLFNISILFVYIHIKKKTCFLK